MQKDFGPRWPERNICMSGCVRTYNVVIMKGSYYLNNYRYWLDTLTILSGVFVARLMMSLALLYLVVEWCESLWRWMTTNWFQGMKSLLFNLLFMFKSHLCTKKNSVGNLHQICIYVLEMNLFIEYVWLICTIWSGKYLYMW